MKTKNRRAIVKRLDTLLRDIIRLRDENTCQRCGRRVEGSNSQPSHVIPKSRSLGLRWNLLNVKLLCIACHRWWHLNPFEAGFWFAEQWPARYVYLQNREHKLVRSWKALDLEAVEAQLKEKLEELKEQKQ